LFEIQAGITTAYQEKPCLNPMDEDCPSTAPNKLSKTLPDIGAELTGGCYGFATKYMHWPEDLIVGGVKKNRTGHIVKANALQSVIQLKGESEMYEYWAKHYKVHNIDWNLEKARQVLEAWQRKFTQIISRAVDVSSSQVDPEDVIEGSRQYSYTIFTTALLDEIMESFSLTSQYKIALGLAIISSYVLLVSWSTDPSRSCAFVSISGIMLISIAIVASLGACALLHLPFNAATTQITPFLGLGLGVFLLFIMVSQYNDLKNVEDDNVSTTGTVLSSVGTTIVLISCCGVISLLSAAILPIPALRSFVLQFAIILVIETTSLLFVFPAIISLDLRRRSERKMDLFCWIQTDNSGHRSPRTTSFNKKVFCAIHSDKSKNNLDSDSLCSCQSDQEMISVIDSNESATCLPDDMKISRSRSEDYSVASVRFFINRLSNILTKKLIQFIVLIVFTFIAIFCLSGIPLVRNGLELTDIVPRDTIEHRFLDAQQKYFSFYHMYAVTEGNFEYPINQRLLYDYHASFTRISKIIKNDDGGLPDFWLALFRDWLSNLQTAYDRDHSLGLISQEGWSKNASEEGILGFKLLVQTGRNDNPIDKTLVNKVKLVDSNGIINPKAFYTYLSAWVTNDALAYYASQANLKPEPREWIHVASDVELKIPKSQPLVFAQMPFYLNRMNSTEEIVLTINEIRSICSRFQERGLPNFPSGIPFTFWEQYVRLNVYFSVSITVCLALVFLFISAFLLKPMMALLVTLLLFLIVAQIYGIMGLLGIGLSAVPGVVIIICVGFGTGFFIPFVIKFMAKVKADDSETTRADRMKTALNKTSTSFVHGIVCFSMSIGMLFFSEFDFIFK